MSDVWIVLSTGAPMSPENGARLNEILCREECVPSTDPRAVELLRLMEKQRRETMREWQAFIDGIFGTRK